MHTSSSLVVNQKYAINLVRCISFSIEIFTPPVMFTRVYCSLPALNLSLKDTNNRWQNWLSAIFLYFLSGACHIIYVTMQWMNSSALNLKKHIQFTLAFFKFAVFYGCLWLITRPFCLQKHGGKWLTTASLVNLKNMEFLLKLAEASGTTWPFTV